MNWTKKGVLAVVDKIDTIITNALAVDISKLNKNLIITMISQIKKSIDKNKEVILQANKIDQKNNNGFIMEFDIIDRIFSNLEKENIFYGDVIVFQKDDEKKLIYGSEIMDKGVVVVINDGNPYVLLEMTIRNLMVGNRMIYTTNGYMYGTNRLIIEIIQSVLEKNNFSPYLVQVIELENYDQLLSNYANINLVVTIGNRILQNSILKISRCKTISSGYENFDLYIEDNTHMDFLNKIIETNLNIQLYINRNIELDYPEAMIVEDVDEAIAQINYSGSQYSSAIFTTSTDNASKFIKEVRSNLVTVNTSPTIERILDIKQNDLATMKTIIYPLTWESNKETLSVSLND